MRIYLHQFYTGCERILERIAVTVDGGLPGGAFSHANLLAQMAQELPGIRPAILNGALWLRLQDYRLFAKFEAKLNRLKLKTKMTANPLF